MDHGYALFDVKAVQPSRRRIMGIASTPELDRQGDTIDPAGLTFRNPVPLLLHHGQREPVGTAILRATPEGIAYEAEIPEVPNAGALKSRVDEAWDSVVAGLIRGVSVGLNIPRAAIEFLHGGRRRVKQAEVCELSLVTVPANASTSIQLIKQLAAMPPRETRAMKTTADYIQSLEHKRAASAARMVAIMEASAESGETLNEAADTEYKSLDLEVKAIDNDLIKWRDIERLQALQAVPVPVAPRTPALPVITVKPNVPPGTAFVRMACALLDCKGNKSEAAMYAEKRWNDSTPEVALALKAAVAPGTTTDAVWAGPLVNQTIANEFLELLRPATILGKIPGLRTVPFNTKVPAQTGGGTYNWVGENKPKPVTSLAFASTTLPISKVAGIIVLTEELVRLSNPSAEALARADMVAGIAQFLDQQFTDPTVTAVAGVRPASITNGAPTAAATSNPLADFMGLIGHFATNNIDVSGLTVIMSPTNALALSFKVNTDGSPVFPGVTMNGGNFRGINIVTSNVVGTNVIALQPNLVLYADDGQVSIDMSREASLQMDSAPASPADATTVYVSLWQTNNVGLRAERFITWLRANANAVKYLTAAAWPAPSGLEAPTAANAKGH